MQRLAILVLIPACFGKSNDVTGGLTTGAITAPVRESRPATAELAMVEDERLDGVELRGFMGAAIDEPAIPNAYGFAIRQLGDGVQTSMQAGWMLASKAGSSMVFARLMFDLLSWTKLDDDTTLSAFSPTADIGIAPFGKGICVSAAGTWDVRFNERDRPLVGIFVGLCGGPMQR